MTAKERMTVAAAELIERYRRFRDTKMTVAAAELIERYRRFRDTNQPKIFHLNKAEFARVVRLGRIGWSGFRTWAQPVSNDPVIEPCPCKGVPELCQHYRVSFRS
jgi:hypothetical protein